MAAPEGIEEIRSVKYILGGEMDDKRRDQHIQLFGIGKERNRQGVNEHLEKIEDDQGHKNAQSEKTPVPEKLAVDPACDCQDVIQHVSSSLL